MSMIQKKQQIYYTYKSGNNKARIDHILANNNCIRKVISSKILTHELDLSDHRALQVIIHAQTISTNNEISKVNNFHKFDWKNKKFITAYNSNVKEHFLKPNSYS